ncbi:hypothetical protein ACFHWT_20905, partial [Micromonospora sp. LOL_021]
VVVEHPGFFLSQDDNPSRSVGEPLEHALVLLTCRAPVVLAGQRTSLQAEARAITLSPWADSAPAVSGRSRGDPQRLPQLCRVVGCSPRLRRYAVSEIRSVR